MIQLQRRSLSEVGEGLEAEPQSLFIRKKEVAICTRYVHSIARDHPIIGIMDVEDKPHHNTTTPQSWQAMIRHHSVNPSRQKTNTPFPAAVINCDSTRTKASKPIES